MNDYPIPRRALLACTALLLARPALAETVRGNGVVRAQGRSVPAFTSIGLDLAAHVEAKQGDSDSVTVEADENLLPLIATVVEGGSLEIRPVRRDLSLDSNSIKVVVRARQLDRLAIRGSGSITANALKSGKLGLELSGSGSIRIGRVEVDRVAIAIAGSGGVTVAGAAKIFSLSIRGSGDVDAASLLSDEAKVSIAGSGDVALGVRSSLQVTIAGSGSVKYTGDPEVRQTVAGSGRVRRVGS